MSSSYAIAVIALLGMLGFALALRHRPMLVMPGKRRPTLHRTLLLSLCLMASVPMISLTLVLAERTARAEKDDVSSRLTAAAQSIAVATDQFIDKHVTGVREIARSAEVAGATETEDFLGLLELGNAIYDDFLTMLVTDADGRVLAATRLVDGRPQAAKFAGHDVADRDYFRLPMRSGRAHISDVFRGRGLGTEPIVAISAPYYAPGGKRAGVIEGSLNLHAFDRLRRFFPLAEFDLAIVDDMQQVVYSTRSDQFPVLEQIAPDSEPAKLARATSASSSGAQTTRTAEHLYAGAGAAAGWTVLTRQALAPIAKRGRREYSIAWAWLAGTIVISILLAHAITHRVTTPLRRLGAAVEAIKLGDSAKEIMPLPQTPLEVAKIFEILGLLDERLQNTFRDLRESITAEAQTREALAIELATREAVIAERTLELTQAKEKLEKVSRTDALTGLYNRLAFNEAQSLTFRVCARAQQPVALLMIDVDFFKRYNDRYGHPAGDACLVQIARTLSGCARRPLDTVARYGGEEFIILLGDCDAEGASQVARCCVADIAALALEHEDSPQGIVTVSVGVSICPQPEYGCADQLLKLADDALYAAKRAGRNDISVADIEAGGVDFDVVVGHS